MPGAPRQWATASGGGPAPRIGAPGMLLILSAESQGQARPQGSFQVFDMLQVVGVRR